jgi:hypothetical protein
MPNTGIEGNESVEMSCRLCCAKLSYRFAANVLGKYDISYYQCEDCRSLQTEKPYWLDEAYKQRPVNLDTGAAQRNMNNLAAVYAIARLFNCRNAIDIGGGDGLLCRLLRDYGLNCFVQDKYATNTYTKGFDAPDFQKPDIVTAFEVLEHFPSPREDLESIFGYGSPVVLVTTEVYRDQGNDWWYISAKSGQHVFFYSKRALSMIARKYNYEVIISGSFILFTNRSLLTPMKSFLAKILLRSRTIPWTKALIALLPARGFWKDHVLLGGRT